MLQGSGAAAVKDDRVSDTSFSAGSLRAAERAAGAMMHAVNQVLAGKQRNAFCCVRPPGHHAGQNGLLPGSESCGFCIFNNIAIGAMHALTAHAETVRRIAIVDIDVHHGNGTEEIVKSLSNHDQILFYSVHLCVAKRWRAVRRHRRPAATVGVTSFVYSIVLFTLVYCVLFCFI